MVGERLVENHKKVNKTFDRRALERYFQPGDLVLKWDAKKEDKGKHGNFDNLWIGPIVMHEMKGNNTFILVDIDGDMIEEHINGKIQKNIYIYIHLLKLGSLNFVNNTIGSIFHFMLYFKFNI